MTSEKNIGRLSILGAASRSLAQSVTLGVTFCHLPGEKERKKERDEEATEEEREREKATKWNREIERCAIKKDRRFPIFLLTLAYLLHIVDFLL